MKNFNSQSSISYSEMYPGCKCKYGPKITPSWHISVKTCPLHSQNYRAYLTPPNMYYGALKKK